MNMHEAKTNLSKLVALVEAGQEVVIGRAGRPVARLVPYGHERDTPRPFGLAKRRVWISDDFDEPDHELIAAFEESGNTPVDVE